jgi:hypothetical protein
MVAIGGSIGTALFVSIGSGLCREDQALSSLLSLCTASSCNSEQLHGRDGNLHARQRLFCQNG